MRPTALAFSGAIASGKTAISSQVAELLNWPRIAFGDFVRANATARGLPHSRAVLQTIGEELIEKRGWTGFCRSVLGMVDWAPGRSIVIDGVRHTEVVSTLRVLVAPSEFLLVFVKADAALRRHRLAARCATEASDLVIVESHSTEKQLVDALPALADLTVNSSLLPESTVRTILEWVRTRQEAGT
jgi:cytidylate kinase